MQDTNHVRLQKNVNENDKVIMKYPPNFYTNSFKKGHFGRTPGIHFSNRTWKVDEYGRKRKMRIKSA